MNNTPSRLLAAVGLSLAACGAVQAAESPEAAYRRERADCMSGRNHQDRATCLKEAGAALYEARRNSLTSPSPEQQMANALARCKSQRVQDRPECERLARGEGSKVGTVAGGAVIKEIVTIEMPPTAAGPAVPASGSQR